jgi:hypothetical protein
MAAKKNQPPLKLGDRARSKLNRRVGTIDAVDEIGGQQHYGLHYDEAPQDRYVSKPASDGAQLPPALIERA